MENDDDAEVTQQQQQCNVLIYSETLKPVVVEAENFQNIVQSLTGGKRKREMVAFAPINVEDVKAPVGFISQQPKLAKVPEQPLLDYLDRLDQECPPPSTGAGRNRGFFATAGLVKGIRLEDGLQKFESPRTARLSSALNFEPTNTGNTDEAPTTGAPCVQLSALQGCKRVCSEWGSEWTGCLSPRSGQLVKEAQKMAVRWNRSGLGPWKINMETMAEIERHSRADDECGYPVDLIYYKGEVIIERT